MNAKLEWYSHGNTNKTTDGQALTIKQQHSIYILPLLYTIENMPLLITSGIRSGVISEQTHSWNRKDKDFQLRGPFWQ